MSVAAMPKVRYILKTRDKSADIPDYGLSDSDGVSAGSLTGCAGDPEVVEAGLVFRYKRGLASNEPALWRSFI